MAATERGRGRRTPALLVAGAAYALGAAATSPFTRPADALTALPIAVVAALAAARWPLRPRPAIPPEVLGRHPYRAWVVLFAVVAAWEVGEYLARGNRGDHPTLSSMADAVDRYYLLKALVFFGWLCLGGFIVRRGMRSRPGAPALGPADAP